MGVYPRSGTQLPHKAPLSHRSCLNATVRSLKTTQSNTAVNRQKWFRHFLATRNFEEAEGLVVSQYEAAEVLKARAAAALGCFAACVGEKRQELR